MGVLEKRSKSSIEPVGAPSGFGAGLIVAPTAAWLLSVMPIIPGGFFFWVICLAVIGFVCTFF